MNIFKFSKYKLLYGKEIKYRTYSLINSIPAKFETLETEKEKKEEKKPKKEKEEEKRKENKNKLKKENLKFTIITKLKNLALDFRKQRRLANLCSFLEDYDEILSFLIKAKLIKIENYINFTNIEYIISRNRNIEEMLKIAKIFKNTKIYIMVQEGQYRSGLLVLSSSR